MKKVRFVFHKSRLEWRNLFNKRQIRLIDDGIALATWPLNLFTPWYSHMSVWIQDEHGKFTKLDDVLANAMFNAGGITGRDYLGTCYTSTMRGDNNGTVSRPASTVFTQPERWEYIEFDVTDESFAEAKAWADERVDKNIGYGKKTIFRFVLPLWLVIKTGLDDLLREICSEHGEGWARRLLRQNIDASGTITIRSGWILMEILIRSPRRLWRDLVRRHHVPTYSLATGLMVRDENGKKVK